MVVRTVARELALDHLAVVRASDQWDTIELETLQTLLLTLAQECMDENLQDAVFEQVSLDSAAL
jgi:hypothetical protein